MRNKVLCGMVLLVGLAAGQARAQEPPAVSQEDAPLLTEWLLSRTALEANVAAYQLALLQGDTEAAKAPAQKVAEASDKLTKVYLKGVNSPAFSTFVIGTLTNDYHKSQATARSAAQATQAATESAAETNLLIAAQNARIIALLEQIAKKP